MWARLFGTTEKVKEKKEEKYTPEFLRQKGKELQEIDNSWGAKLRTKLSFLERLGMENARKHARFTDEKLILAIKKQEIEDRKELKTKREALLKDPQYLSKKYDEREEIDNSWTAFFCGTNYARADKGFDPDLNLAVDNWKKTHIGRFFGFLSLWDTRGDQPAEKKPRLKSDLPKEIAKKQIGRKQSR